MPKHPPKTTLLLPPLLSFQPHRRSVSPHHSCPGRARAPGRIRRLRLSPIRGGRFGFVFWSTDLWRYVDQHISCSLGYKHIFGCGPKPMVPFWGRCTTYYRTYLRYGILTHGHLSIYSKLHGICFWRRPPALAPDSRSFTETCGAS